MVGVTFAASIGATPSARLGACELLACAAGASVRVALVAG